MSKINSKCEQMRGRSFLSTVRLETVFVFHCGAQVVSTTAVLYVPTENR